MKTMIVYSSQTGNTKKLAEAVRDALQGDTELYPITEAPAAKGYEL
jgi:flavodoxin